MIIAYIIKSTLCLALLLGFYKLLLEGSVIHSFKRFYLLGSLVFALSIPMLTITYTTYEVAPDIATTAIISDSAISTTSDQPQNQTAWLSWLLWSIYVIGALLFASRFCLNLWRLQRKIKAATQIPKQSFTLALLSTKVIPHSFFKWIFLSQEPYEKQQIAPEIIAHEATHVKQRHSIDIILIEFLQVIFWFNPLLRWIKIAIKTNHEFLADRGVLHTNTPVSAYQNILLNFASSPDQAAFESPFNYSLTKKRILMLSKTINSKRVWASSLLLLPLVGLCVFLFNQDIIAQPVETESHKQQQTDYATSFIEGAQNNGVKALVIEIFNDQINVNGSSAPISNLRNVIDKITKNWTTQELNSAVPSMLFKNNSPEFLEKANQAFIGTRLAKQQGLAFPLTPRPADTPTVIGSQQLELQQKPPTAKEIKTYNKLAAKYEDGYKGKINLGEVAIMYDIYTRMSKKQKKSARPYPVLPPPPPPPPTPASPVKVVKGSKTDGDVPPPPPPPAPKAPKSDLPPPPPPPSPEEHFVKMRKLGGEFYFEDKKITFAQAVELVNTNTKLHISTPYPYSTPPKTYISKKPIKTKKKTKELKAVKQEKRKSPPKLAQRSEKKEQQDIKISGVAHTTTNRSEAPAEIAEIEEVIEPSEIASVSGRVEIVEEVMTASDLEQLASIQEEVEIVEDNYVSGKVARINSVSTLIADGAECFLDQKPITKAEATALLTSKKEYEVLTTTDQNGRSKVYFTTTE